MPKLAKIAEIKNRFKAEVEEIGCFESWFSIDNLWQSSAILAISR
jgi:hypothetical protein